MAITTNAICNSFKKQLLGAEHDFDSSSGDTFKLAMYVSTATLGASTTNYSTAGEVSSPSGYAAGGKALVNSGVKVSSGVAITDFSDLSFTWCRQDCNSWNIYNPVPCIHNLCCNIKNRLIKKESKWLWW
jgi:hypothetical protein